MLQQCNERPYTPVQPADVSTEPSSQKTLTWKGSDVELAGKPSGFDYRVSH